jgi:two-component system sensor histidine kinase CpxA
VRSEDPVRYWVGIRLTALDRDSFRPGGLTLLISSESLRGGGLFIDLTPWIIVGFAAVLFSVLFWIPLITGITRSVAQMTRATELIAEGSFDARVVTNRRDELGSLGEAINRMAMRLAGFVNGQKRFLGDIAHELCAPLARLQMALGILEQRAGQQAPRVDDVREEVQHMSSLVNELLSFSKASLRQEPVELEPVALAALARRIVEREAKAGEIIEVRIDPALHALAEPELLARALSNLVRNALRHAQNAGPLLIAASRQGEGKGDAERVQLTISDSGPGIPEDAREKIFDPFYRLEASRSRETGGVGLGLAIVKTCVEACHGTVSARNRQPHGLEVQIVLRATANSGTKQVLRAKP